MPSHTLWKKLLTKLMSRVRIEPNQKGCKQKSEIEIKGQKSEVGKKMLVSGEQIWGRTSPVNLHHLKTHQGGAG
jgi:hypothetical protein